MNNKEFGQRVRQLREQALMTREQFCDDEIELSVRQLTRIEAGTCKPTFSKINFIADRLGMGLYELMPDYVRLPERYSKIKFDVLRTPTYGDEELVETRNEMIAEIYDEYYDDLPEEEQIAMDAFQSVIDVFETKSTEYGREILDDYFEQVYRKRRYTINDLLILRLYLEHMRFEAVSSQMFQIFLGMVKRFPNQTEVIDPNDLFIFRDVMLTSIGILGTKEQFDYIPALFDTLDKLMMSTQDFQKKPILNLLKWKYELRIHDNKERAREFYEEAVLFAKIIGSPHLAKKLEEDWLKDSQQ